MLTIVMLVCNKLALNYLKIRLPTNYWQTNHTYKHLTVCKQTSLKMLTINCAFRKHFYYVLRWTRINQLSVVDMS